MDESSHCSSMLEDEIHSSCSERPHFVEQEIDQDEALKKELASWHVKFHCTFQQSDALLRILKPYHPTLPRCARTLVRTQRITVGSLLSIVPPGKYYHFGIEAGIYRVLKSLGIKKLRRHLLKIFVGVDGVHLVNSSSSKFYAIVGYISSLPDSPPFVIGVYHGYFQPEDCNLFLKDLIEEAEGLYEIGFSLDNDRIIVVIAAFICDAPARAMVTCTKSHSSEQHGCSRCTGRGIICGRLRTNENFRENMHPEHHHVVRSIIENLLYFDMVFHVPLDPMHLVDLGIMRRILSFLFPNKQRRNTPGVTLQPHIVRNIDEFVISLRKFISRIDFARQPRSIKELPRWKATELRQFLLYIGVVVLKPYLPIPFYNNFMCLHVPIKLLASEEWCLVFNDYAHDLLVSFVQQSDTLYSSNFVSYNVHNLLHISHDVLTFGPLYSFSAYRFENYYGQMKKYLRKTDKPLEQLIKRLDEENRSNIIRHDNGTLEKGSFKFSNIHSDGPLPDNCDGTQFQSAEKGKEWNATSKGPDNCVFLSDLSIIIVRNFVKYQNRYLVIGQKFEVQSDFYQCPCPSSSIHEFQVSALSPIIQAWPVDCIKYKAVKLPATFPHNDSFVVFPLLRQ
jgi:hypothetical protein